MTLLKSAELETRSVCMEMLFIVDLVFEQMPGQWFFSQYCIHLLGKPVRTYLLLCDAVAGKLQLKATEQSDVNKTKKTLKM